MHVLGLMFLILPILLALGFIFFVFWLWVAWRIYSYVQNRKKQHAHRLATYLRRMRPIVAELLHQANELDQASKYSGLDQDAKWAKKYGDALNKLLDASSKLEETNVILLEQQLKPAQETILYVIRTVHIVSYRMKEMQPIEEIVDLKAQLLFEQSKHDHSDHGKEARAADATVGHNTAAGTEGGGHSSPHVVKLTDRAKTDEQPISRVTDKKKQSLGDDLTNH
jgi:hypothetical protein